MSIKIKSLLVAVVLIFLNQVCQATTYDRSEILLSGTILKGSKLKMLRIVESKIINNKCYSEKNPVSYFRLYTAEVNLSEKNGNDLNASRITFLGGGRLKLDTYYLSVLSKNHFSDQVGYQVEKKCVKEKFDYYAGANYPNTYEIVENPFTLKKMLKITNERLQLNSEIDTHFFKAAKLDTEEKSKEFMGFTYFNYDDFVLYFNKIIDREVKDHSGNSLQFKKD